MDFPESDAGDGQSVDEGSSSQRPKHALFAVTAKKPDLGLLCHAYDNLTSSEKNCLEFRFGKIADILTIIPDWNLFRGMMRFYVPALRTFVFPQFELAVTVDEYHHLLQCSSEVKASIFEPKPDHLHLTKAQIQDMLRNACGLSYEFTDTCITKEWDNGGFDWNVAYKSMGHSLVSMTVVQRLNFVALGIYGMVIFPIYVKSIAPMVIVMFDQLVNTMGLNPVPTIVAETIRSMNAIRNKKKTRFLCSIELFTVWAHGHLTQNCFNLNSLASFSNLSPPPLSADDWQYILASMSSVNVNWVLASGCSHQCLCPPEGHYWIPLLGIRGGVSYTTCLARRQLWDEQGVPKLDGLAEFQFDYVPQTSVMNQICKSVKLWSTSRMVQNSGQSMVSGAYLKWRSVWISSIVMPFDVSKTKDAYIAELEMKLDAQEKEWVARRQELQKELAELKLDYDILKGEKELANKEIESLRQGAIKLKGDLEERKKFCLKQKDRLKNADKMKKEFNQLKKDHKALKQEKQLLEEEIKDLHVLLRDDMVCAQNAYQNSLTAYGPLQEELKAVKSSNPTSSADMQGQAMTDQ